MQKIKELYLFRLFRQNKFLFAFVLLFIFFQQFFYLKGNSTFPWFHWSMYSYPAYQPESVTQIEYFINGKRLNLTTLPIWQEATISHTFEKYHQLEQNGFRDPMDTIVRKRTSILPSELYPYIAYCINNHPEDAKRYPYWLKTYLKEQVIHESVQNLEIKKVTYRYQDAKFQAADSGTILFKQNF
jgi:hypothetical protein